MESTLSMWYVVSIIFGGIVIGSSLKNDMEKGKFVIKIKHIVFGILFLPMTLTFLFTVFLIKSGDWVSNMRITEYIKDVMNKRIL